MYRHSRMTSLTTARVSSLKRVFCCQGSRVQLSTTRVPVRRSTESGRPLFPQPPISRILSYRPLAGTTGPSSLWTTHCCGPQAAYLRISGPPHLRVLALLRVGLAKPRHHCRAGEPLPRLFTLAGACAPAVCFLLRFPSHHCAWPLTSTLPCGVRTFLRQRGFPRQPRRSGELGRASLSFTVLKFPHNLDPPI